MRRPCKYCTLPRTEKPCLCPGAVRSRAAKRAGRSAAFLIMLLTLVAIAHAVPTTTVFSTATLSQGSTHTDPDIWYLNTSQNGTYTIYNATFYAGIPATRAYVKYYNNRSVLANVSIVGNVGIFNVNVTSGQNVTIEVDNNGVTWNEWYDNAQTGVLINTTAWRYVGASDNAHQFPYSAQWKYAGILRTLTWEQATVVNTLTLAVSDNKTGASIPSFSFIATNGSVTWSGYCGAASCSNSTFNMTGGTVTFWNMTGYYNATNTSVTYYNNASSTITGYAMNKTRTLVVTTYFAGGMQNNTYTIGELLPNQTYDVGFIAKSLYNGSYWKEITVMFNGTILNDSRFIAGSTANPWSTNVACLDAANECQQYFFFGGDAITNLSANITGVSTTSPVSLDEVYVGTQSSIISADSMSPAYMVAVAQTPTMSFSPVFISNLFPPAVSLSLNPSNPSNTDDVTGSVNYTDSDANNGTVVMEWRVNGTKVNTTTYQAVTTNSIVSNTILKGNYTKGSTLNLTAWAFDGMYYSTNNSVQVTVQGIKPLPVTSLSCIAVNKTGVNCTWNPAVANTTGVMVIFNGTNTYNLSNTSSSTSFAWLAPNTTYNITMTTISPDGSIGDGVSSIVTTMPDYTPVITDIVPSNTTPLYDEGVNVTFSVNATGDTSDGVQNNVIISWFKDNVFQAFGNAWTWIVGKNEQGSHTITAVANDSYGRNASQNWNVTIFDTYPAPNPPVFSPNGGVFRTYIPVKCLSTNSYSAVDYYNMMVSVNGAAYENVSTNNKMGFLQFDITQYDYGTNFTFNCTASGESGNVSSTSSTFTRDYVSEFYATTTQESLSFSSKTPYTFGLYYDTQNPTKNVTVMYSYADCNGDGQYDYVYNYTSTNPARIKQRFLCAFGKGLDTFEIGVYLKKSASDTWAGTGCSTDYDYSSTCLVKKQYHLMVD